MQGGIVGVAPGSSLYSINVFGRFTATTSDILAGMDWVQQFNAKVNYTNGRGKIRVINMSFGDYSDPYKSTDGISMVNSPKYPYCGAGNQKVDPWHTGESDGHRIRWTIRVDHHILDQMQVSLMICGINAGCTNPLNTIQLGRGQLLRAV